MSLIRNEKKAIRQILLQKRANLSQQARIQASKNAAKLLSQSDYFQTAQHIACYMALPNEFDCQRIIETIWQANKKCYLPVISQTKELVFIHYKRNDALILNQYHIPEPVKNKPFLAKDLDLVIIPLVGFDRLGNRIGMGAGFYDRTFAFLKTQSHQSCRLIGLGYTFQEVNELPIEEWDIPLDGILTEHKLLFFKRDFGSF